jgi:pectin methylesterase-like acyl-CoA thioesterase
VSESKFTAELCTFAERLGFEVWPVGQFRGKPRYYVRKGPADIIMFGHGVTLFVETKVGSYEPQDAQNTFAAAATRNGSVYWVIHSTDEFLTLGRCMNWWK